MSSLELSPALAPIPMPVIVKAVSAAFAIDESMLLSSRREAPVVRARFALYWLAHHVAGMSYAAIGRRLGRDHTTILYGVAQADALRAEDQQYAETLNAIGNTLLALARSEHEAVQRAMEAQRQAEPDPRAVVARVLGGGPRGRYCAADELTALARSWRLLDRLAAETAQLIADIDVMLHARGSEEARLRARRARATIPHLAAALTALGYAPDQQEPDHGQQDQDARREFAGAAE